VLRGRVDGLEKKVGKLEAQQFSTTTKLRGEVTMVMGGLSYSSVNPNNNSAVTSLSSSNPGSNPSAGAARNAVSFNYDMRLNFNTSFTGKDLLFTRLRSGNFRGSAFGGGTTTAGVVNSARLDKASSDGSNNSQQNVFLDRLYYSFPIGNELTATLAPRARNTEMIAFRPQAYNADILDFFTLAGAPNAYNKATGAGFGLVWKQKVKKGNPYLTASVNYVAQQGMGGDPNGGITSSAAGQTTAAGGGLFNASSASNVTVQIGGRGSNWGVAALYRFGTCGTDLRDGTPMAAYAMACNGQNSATNGNNASSNSLGLGAYWQPKETGWIPSISLGWGYTGFTQSSTTNTANPQFNPLNVSAAQSWSAMFQWDNAFAKGNAAGFALGQPSFATALRNGATPGDSNFAFEWFYRFRVSDNISVTPAVFYLNNSVGALNSGLSNTGVLVQTQFRF